MNDDEKISVEDVKEHHDRIAKMRSLLFRHEMKAKRIKKIKSKTYRRLLKKDRFKTASTDIHMDPEAAKELAMKQEFKRAEVIDLIFGLNNSLSFEKCCLLDYANRNDLELLHFLSVHRLDTGALDSEAQKQFKVGKAHFKARVECSR